MSATRSVRAKHRKGQPLEITFYGDETANDSRQFIADLVKALTVSPDFTDVKVTVTETREVTL